MKSSSLLFLLLTTSGNSFQQQSSTSSHRRLDLTLQNSKISNDSAASLPPELQLAMDRKNKSRQKFGLEPLSAPQFLELQGKIAEMEEKQQQIYQQNQQQKGATKRSEKNFIAKMVQKGLEDTCYSSFDCESPKVCCDLGFKKMCCSNGMMEVNHAYALEPIPVDMRE